MPISNIKNDTNEMQMHETLRGSCLRAEWNQTTLGEICARQNGSIQTGPFGSQLHTSDYKEFGTPVVMPTNIGDGGIDETGIARISQEDVNRLSQHVLKKGDIIFSRRGDVTKNALVRTRETGWFCGTGCLKVRVGDESVATADFISQYLRLSSIKEWLVRHAVGATMPNLNTGILAAVPVTLPPLDEQKQIAKILDDFDHKIELNRQTNQTLEQIAQALFKSWFVDFEPTRAKITAKEAGASPEEIERAAMCAISGKTPDQLAQLPPETQQNLKTTAALFPDALMDSELGEVPEGWEVSEIGKEVDVVGGGTPSTANTEFWEDGEHHWTTPKDMSNLTDKILLETDRKITDAGLKKISSGLLPRNTVLMSSRAPVGYLAIAKIPVAINQGYIAMKCEKILSPEYVVQWAESVMDEIKQRSSGTTFAEISKTNFRLIRTLVPNEKLVQAYTKEVSSVYEKITSLLLENRELISIRDSLLPKLLSGSLAIGIDNEGRRAQ